MLEKKIRKRRDISNNLMISEFKISVKFSYDLPVFVSTSNVHGNSKLFTFKNEIQKKYF